MKWRREVLNIKNTATKISTETFANDFNKDELIHILYIVDWSFIKRNGANIFDALLYKGLNEDEVIRNFCAAQNMTTIAESIHSKFTRYLGSLRGLNRIERFMHYEHLILASPLNAQRECLKLALSALKSIPGHRIMQVVYMFVSSQYSKRFLSLREMRDILRSMLDLIKEHDLHNPNAQITRIKLLDLLNRA